LEREEHQQTCSRIELIESELNATKDDLEEKLIDLQSLGTFLLLYSLSNSLGVELFLQNTMQVQLTKKRTSFLDQDRLLQDESDQLRNNLKQLRCNSLIMYIYIMLVFPQKQVVVC
jgi:hypothetical protein